MKTQRPKLRQTIRTRNAALLYEDKARSRFVVYRRAGGVTRKTSVRYKSEDHTDWTSALGLAEYQADRLKNWPAHKLSTFKF